MDAISKAAPTSKAAEKVYKDIPLFNTFLDGRKNTAPMRARFGMWINAFASGQKLITAEDLTTQEKRASITERGLVEQIHDAEAYAQAASWAKKLEEYRAYNGDILNMTAATVKKLNKSYGLRFYSFSEYTPAFIVENMQQIRDASLKGLYGLAYTKKVDFAKIFAKTGMNINVSTFGHWKVDSKGNKVLDADGNPIMVMDTLQGADWEEVKALREEFANVGAVFVATDDDAVRWAKKQDWIDVVIPFHIVRTGANVAEFYKWVVHNSEQADLDEKGRKKDINPPEHRNDYKTYLSLCAKRGLTPRFKSFLDAKLQAKVVAGKQLSAAEDLEMRQYMKLVNETRLSTHDSEKLRPVFNENEAKRSFDEFVQEGGYYGDWYKAKNEQSGVKQYDYNEAVDQVVSDIEQGRRANEVDYGRQDIDVGDLSEAVKNRRNLPRTHGQSLATAPTRQSLRATDAEYLSLAEKYRDGTASAEDIDVLNNAVAEAARKAGYTIKAYHGTYAFGRTKFTDYGGALFLTDNPDVGRAFSGSQPIRQIASQVNPDTMSMKDAVKWFDQNLHWGEKHIATEEDFAKELDRLKPLTEAELKMYGLNSKANDDARRNQDIVKAKLERFRNGETFYYFDFNGINKDYANSPLADIEDFRRMVRDYGISKDRGGGVYEMFVKPGKIIEVDAKGSYYANIPLPYTLQQYASAEQKQKASVSSDELVRLAYLAGYDTLAIKNVIEGGDYGYTAKGTDYVVMNAPSQVKSADPVTYDDNGDIIPLSERFNEGNEDIRYQSRNVDVDFFPTEKKERKYSTEGVNAQGRNYAARREADARLAERMHEGAIRARIERKANETEAEYKARIKKIYEDRYRREIKNTALKWNKKLVDMLARPTENKHVPVQLARSVAEFCEEVTKYLDGTTKRGEKILDKIRKAYDRAFTDEQTILRAKSEDAGYDARGAVLNNSQKDEQLAEMLKELSDITAEKSFAELTRDEMDALLNVVRGVAHTVTEANKLIGEAEGKTVWQTGSTMIEQLENAPKVSTKLRGYLATSLDLRRLARIFSGSNEDAEFVKLVEQLNQGAIEKERVAQELQAIFKPVTDEYGNEIKKWYGKKAEWLDTGIVTKDGVPVKITKGMRVSLALHVLNEGNMRHIERGGLTIPDAKLYAQGKLADAYANGKLIRLTAEQINDIIANTTEAEKAYVEAAKELFHDRAGFYVNKTSLQLAGYTKANVENYFPIHTDKNFNKTDFASMSMDGSIEGQGFLQERKNASNPIYLEDITSVVNRQIRGVALYAGMAIPVRNFNAVLKTAVYEDENGDWVPRTSVKQTLKKTMGAYGAKVVEGFVEDASEMS
ncbi:MAG: hypothetical protein II410_07740, partial [Ruminococcus sp.]|nr:hypothetical protein [Ruminococcus sp.]